MLLLLACAGSEPEPKDDTATTEPLAFHPLGHGEDVTWTPILGSDERLDDPRDLGFDAEGYLWVANREDDRTFIVFDPGTEEQSHQRRRDGYAEHFMEETAAFSFDGGTQFGSCGESNNTYNDAFPGNGFMGPVLWTTDLTVFGEMDPYGLGSHLDMLHESPYCVGIAWHSANVYYVFDGEHSRVVRYDFAVDHGIGEDDHSDGIVYQLSEPEVTRVEEAPGHMVMDHAAQRLYVADTGGGRILWIDVTSGERGRPIRGAPEPLADYAEWDGVVWGEVATGLTEPGGLALWDGTLLVGEWGTGTILQIGLDGTVLQTMDTGLGAGALYGIEIGPDGHLWVTETATPGVWRLDPAPLE